MKVHQNIYQSHQNKHGRSKNYRYVWDVSTCTQDTNNIAPNEYREVVNLSGLAVYKGSNAKGNSDNATKGKVKR